MIGIVLLTGILSFRVVAQDSSLFTIKQLATKTFNDGISAPFQPFQWNKKQLMGFGAFALATGAAFYIDEPVYDWTKKNQYPAAQNLSKYFLEPLGAGKITLPLVCGLFTYGAIKKDYYLANTSALALESFIISASYNRLIKQSFHRHRPYETNPTNSNIWDGPSLKLKHVSFNSGHTSLLFSIASVYASAYSYKKGVPVLCYSLATLAALSRIYDGKHWSSDVVSAAAISFSIGRMVWGTKGKYSKQ